MQVAMTQRVHYSHGHGASLKIYGEIETMGSWGVGVGVGWGGARWGRAVSVDVCVCVCVWGGGGDHISAAHQSTPLHNITPSFCSLIQCQIAAGWVSHANRK